MGMRSFIRAAEIWLPDEAGTSLVYGDGLYGDLVEFGELSRGVRFGRGEGLPGRAWAQRHPVVLKDLGGSAFLRSEAAASAGLTSAVAMPVFAGDAIKAVVVLLCGDDADHVGAIEVWHNDPETETQIGLFDGYYGAAELFEITSRMTKFGKGTGLPGAVWQSGMPVAMRDLYSSTRFLRREEALKVGLTFGFGIPFDYDPGQTWVMTFLSALGTPIASRFEVWVPEDGHLALEAGVPDEDASGKRPSRIANGDGLLGRVAQSHLPAISELWERDAPWIGSETEGGGGRAAIAIPVLHADGRLKAATLWAF